MPSPPAIPARCRAMRPKPTRPRSLPWSSIATCRLYRSRPPARRSASERLTFLATISMSMAACSAGGGGLGPGGSPGAAEPRFDQAAGAGLDGEQPSRIALTRGLRIRAPVADRGDEERAHLAASERRHGRLLDGKVDAPIDDTVRRDPEPGPAGHTGDPVAAVLVDAGPVGAAREWTVGGEETVPDGGARG